MDVLDCRTLIEQMLSAYVDDDLDPATAQKLELHMQLCAPCAAFLRTFLAARRAARSEVVAHIPRQCQDSLAEFLQRETGVDLGDLQVGEHSHAGHGCSGGGLPG